MDTAAPFVVSVPNGVPCDLTDSEGEEQLPCEEVVEGHAAYPLHNTGEHTGCPRIIAVERAGLVLHLEGEEGTNRVVCVDHGIHGAVFVTGGHRKNVLQPHF